MRRLAASVAQVLAGYALVTAFVAALLFASACGASARNVLDASGLAVDAAAGTLAVQYEREGNALIDAAATADEAKAALAEHRASWSPLWQAFASFRAVHSELSDRSDRGESVDVSALVAAYCAARFEALGRVSLPDIGCAP